MNNKKWFYLLISILCIVAFIGSYIYGYKPYAEKKILRDNYHAIVNVFEQYNQKKQKGSDNDKGTPLSAEQNKVLQIRKDLYEITGKITTTDNKNTLNMMIKATYDLEKIIISRREFWLSLNRESKQNYSIDKTLDDAMDLIIQRARQETEFNEKTLPLIKGYVE